MSLNYAAVLRQSVRPESLRKLEDVEVFETIDSTNSYLLRLPGPAAGMCRVALADCQTAGRGRRERNWVSPPGRGLYLSIAYTFQRRPRTLSALTLAVGIAVIDALQNLGVSGVSLKWPNDLVLNNAKLGGILTEVQQEGDDALTVVSGIGINIALPASLQVGLDSEWAQMATDLSRAQAVPPGRAPLAAAVIDELVRATAEFEQHGFAQIVKRWPAVDWLFGRNIVVNDDVQTISGVASGIDSDGALLVKTGATKKRVLSGSISLVGPTGASH